MILVTDYRAKSKKRGEAVRPKPLIVHFDPVSDDLREGKTLDKIRLMYYSK